MAKPRRWWWIVAGGVLVAVVVAFVVVRFVVLRDTTTTISSDDVLARFRASTTTTSTSSPATPSTTSATTAPTPVLAPPQPGVYQYATSGHEHVDALGGTTHDYPATTTITVTDEGCGVQQRWDVLQERWSSRQLCVTADGVVSGGYTDFHRFFGQDDRADWTCTPPYVLVPTRPEAGASWPGACTDGSGTAEATTITVVGLEPVTVGGTTVPAVHIQRVEQDTGGDTTASTTTDSWLDVASGLLLKEQASSTSTTSSPIGDVHYSEQYELTLTALQPQR